MEFHEKLSELRRSRGLTQEELAASLYVSRTAVSKWESGRGYPSIESLRAISDFFSVSLDELLSSREAVKVAECEREETGKRFRDLAFGLLDVSASLLWFLPLFATKNEGYVKAVSLMNLGEMALYLKIFYWLLVGATCVMGLLTLALQRWEVPLWTKSKMGISFSLGVVSVLLFALTLQPYATVFAFALLAMKVLLKIKRP